MKMDTGCTSAWQHLSVEDAASGTMLRVLFVDCLLVLMKKNVYLPKEWDFYYYTQLS